MKHLAIWYFDIGWLLILPVYGLWGWACGAKMVSASTHQKCCGYEDALCIIIIYHPAYPHWWDYVSDQTRLNHEL